MKNNRVEKGVTIGWRCKIRGKAGAKQKYIFISQEALLVAQGQSKCRTLKMRRGKEAIENYSLNKLSSYFFTFDFDF